MPCACAGDAAAVGLLYSTESMALLDSPFSYTDMLQSLHGGAKASALLDNASRAGGSWMKLYSQVGAQYSTTVVQVPDHVKPVKGVDQQRRHDPRCVVYRCVRPSASCWWRAGLLR